ncbi:DUF6507 family protein [Streptomyces sp. NPDC007100]|uniref:DUF6507 family protein n=1 Tax=Streptomyces sp. NPDC007100 TaxID=3155602 RepID=UPI0033C4C4A3
MTGWDITPSGVYQVLNKTREQADGLAEEVSSYDAHLRSAAEAAGTLVFGAGAAGAKGGAGGATAPGGPVAAALGEFSQHTADNLLFLVARTGKSVAGAAEATTAYDRGLTEMAANAQHAALSAPDLEQFKAETARRQDGDGK